MSISGEGEFKDMHAAIERAGNVNQAIAAFCQHYGTPFVTYHLAQAVAPGFDAPFVRTTYPDAWVARYLLRDYVKIDPIVREGFQRMLPFEWSEVELDMAAGRIMADAVAHGIVPAGYSVPVIDRIGRRALLSVNALADDVAWKMLLAESRAAWTELAHTIHRKAIVELFGKADPAPRLGPRELECLQWSALGKDHKAIAIILGISEHTARGYIKSARFKLGCSSLPQAVSRAMLLRLINP